MESFFVSDNFLRYHPNLRVKGEISFLEGYDHVMEKMPTAYENETILVKSRGAWHQPDVAEVIRKHYDLIPDVKMIMLVRDPIHRYVSGKILKNLKRGHTIFHCFPPLIY